MRCLCFQLCQNHRTIMLRMPGSPNSKIRSLAIKIHRIPLQSEDFFSSQTCVQPQHHKHIRRQAVNGIQQLIHLLIRKRKTILLRNPAHILLQIDGRILINDLTLHCCRENTFIYNIHGFVHRCRLFRCRQQCQANVIRCYIPHMHIAQGLNDVVLHFRCIVNQRCHPNLC